jgi:hypothetical protein
VTGEDARRSIIQIGRTRSSVPDLSKDQSCICSGKTYLRWSDGRPRPSAMLRDSAIPMMLRNYEYRRRLPHYQSDLKAIFVTFTTYRRWILPQLARAICLDVCTFGDGKRFTLHGVIIMPDHVHMVFTPLWDQNGFSAWPKLCKQLRAPLLIVLIET